MDTFKIKLYISGGVFLPLFPLFVSHVARYTPSSLRKNQSKISRRKYKIILTTYIIANIPIFRVFTNFYLSRFNNAVAGFGEFISLADVSQICSAASSSDKETKHIILSVPSPYSFVPALEIVYDLCNAHHSFSIAAKSSIISLKS